MTTKVAVIATLAILVGAIVLGLKTQATQAQCKSNVALQGSEASLVASHGHRYRPLRTGVSTGKPDGPVPGSGSAKVGLELKSSCWRLVD